MGRGTKNRGIVFEIVGGGGWVGWGVVTPLRTMALKPRKFCIRRNNNKVDSIETGRIVVAHLLR